MKKGDPPDQTTLGSCPRCESEIPHADMLIIYEYHEQRIVYAYCAHCDYVVNLA